MPVSQHPLREGVRDNTNHYVTGRDGGRDIDLRRFALEGMQLHGLLEGFDAGTLRFQPTCAKTSTRPTASTTASTPASTASSRRRASRRHQPASTPPSGSPKQNAARSTCSRPASAPCSGASASGPTSAGCRPDVFDARGHPQHERGVTSHARAELHRPALAAHLGLGPLLGRGRDAAHLARSAGARIGRGGLSRRAPMQRPLTARPAAGTSRCRAARRRR